ncbi:DUF2637 domain-containing protein [Streptomyces sp. ICBB 8177]|uniref:DUF2637 domain-containing protein n=1 Tax=Streptomyces sp. ICBB 8177 TaxID=563922 RepID=UPI000D679F63|nr:DUF2637 domain-containing protein [Streptomyces sp. ICBB 8177]PWI44685.1 hypothetical protein CK485_08150 [Streptomyces sp. ICBB 8177]
MTAPYMTEGAAVPPLTKPEVGLAGFGALAAAGVGVLGLLSSFDAVSAAGARWGFAAPWMLPVGVDVAIPVFTIANLLLIRLDMALAWVRFVPWVLTLVTCGLNVAAGSTVAARVAHGTMPLLWVVFSEIGAHVYAVRIGAVTGRRMEKVRWSRWLLAPVSTFALWRRMALWEVTSYSAALVCERERLLARADLRERYGWAWRWKTPRRARVVLRMGELSPIVPTTDQDPAPEAPPEPEAKPAPQPDHESMASKAPRKRQSKGRKAAPAQRTADELLAEARALSAGWADTEINAEALRKALRCGSAPARQVRDVLLAERAEALSMYPVASAPIGEEVAA